MSEKLIIWDWNGTLLDDAETCVKTMNVMLLKRDREPINQEYYKDIFTFPVKEYYKLLGFDFNQESFEELSVEYIDLYKKFALDSPLQKGSLEILEFFKSRNYKQIILSASEQISLENQAKQRGVYYYFDSVLGLNNIYAKSKLDNATKFINEFETKFDKIILIGDTFHDYEVAKEIGAECVLIQAGHQNLNRFDLNGKSHIIKDFLELIKIVNSKKSFI